MTKQVEIGERYLYHGREVVVVEKRGVPGCEWAIVEQQNGPGTALWSVYVRNLKPLQA